MTFNEKLNYSDVKRTRIIITLALLSMLTISIYSSTTLSVVKALDLSSLGGNYGLPGIGLGNICFASDCTNQNIKDNQNSPVVTDSENTNIESGEGNLGSDDGTGTLSVSIETSCGADAFTCGNAVPLPQYPTSEDYSITISGNNPHPSKFNGNNDVELGAGEFTMNVTSPNTKDLSEALLKKTGLTYSVFSVIGFEGDCKFSNARSLDFYVGTGTMSAGDSQFCVITNSLNLVPE